mmetsp:Transcript_36631/g.114023  ORF Transcript_36631/g.114023 Transcript_36631/m.114023 type:complete len:369 (+) Transcript_36631:80-1186(+)
MAHIEASPLPLALAEPEDMESSSTEELLSRPPRQDAWCARPGRLTAGLLAALAACALLPVGLPRGSSNGTVAANVLSTAQPVSVRQFLEGPELADAVTENFMRLGHGYVSLAQRGEVRAAVSKNLANISGSLRARLPEDHAKLELVQLKQAQKESVLRILRHYADPRVLSLGNDIGEAMDDMKAEAGDRRSFQRRLSEKLRPKLRELRELCDDIAPGTGKGLRVDADDFADIEPVQVPGKWHVQVEMTPPKVAFSDRPSGLLAVRRLSPADTLYATRDQATTALQHIGGMLGKTMPSAPARMLLFDRQKELEKRTTGFERMSRCVMENMSKLPDLFQCLMTNCRRAMTWLMNKLHLGDMMENMMSHHA